MTSITIAVVGLVIAITGRAITEALNRIATALEQEDA